MRAYASAETHTWIQKAADLAGLGTDSVRFIATGDDLRMDVAALERRRRRPTAPPATCRSWSSGTAGSVSTGAVDDLPAIARICARESCGSTSTAPTVDSPPRSRARPRTCSRCARRTTAVIGVTVAAFGTSSPELLVAINAAVGGVPQISLGDVLGSNVVNISLVLAIVLGDVGHEGGGRRDAP